ncbi:epidermal growth factor receptor kinase substrate 8-like protein 3 [Aulostomus maculatus]
MIGTNSNNDTSSYAGSIESNGYSTMDEVSSQASCMSRPSAKSIYLQRKEYAESMNKMMKKHKYRVEHLFTCELDGMGLRNIADCVEQLKLLDRMGRVWGQNMVLELRDANLMLTDMETKEELETFAVSDVLELKAVLDASEFNSLLTLSVSYGGKPNVFMFQCEDLRADDILKSLSKAISRSLGDSRVRSTAGSAEGREAVNDTTEAGKTPEPQEQKPAADSAPQEPLVDYEEDNVPEPELVALQEQDDKEEAASLAEVPLPAPRSYTELDRNADIWNHISKDIEIFAGHVAAVAAKHAKKKKKNKKGKVLDGMPPEGDFATCLHKIKYAFNLLSELNGQIKDLSAPECVHSLFSTLAFIVPHCPEDLPPTIVAPLFTPQSIRLLSEEASGEEDQLWQSLGDAWNIPSTKWPEDDEDIPTFTLTLSDGWQPPELHEAPESNVTPERGPEMCQPASNQMSGKCTPAPSTVCSGGSKPHYMRAMNDFVARNDMELTILKGEVVELLESSKLWWKVKNSIGQEGYVPNNVLEPWPKASPIQTKKSKPTDVKSWFKRMGSSKVESKLRHMRATCDFISRKHMELTIKQGEIVELLDTSKLWWKVKNTDGQEGYVPNNVLEPCDGKPIDEVQPGAPPVLTKKSKPAEVKAWLIHLGFTKITVACLGVLSGSLLLGMSREELKAVCPEEGGKVFFKLQEVKLDMAAAS